jgi:hypothetical protein
MAIERYWFPTSRAGAGGFATDGDGDALSLSAIHEAISPPRTSTVW